MSDTIKLLKECNKGCNTAITSMIEMMQQIENEELKEVISKYTEQHKKIEEKTEILLKEQGESEKEPGIMAESMIKMQTTVKVGMSMNHQDRNCAEMMRKGCNMGIETLTEKMHEYKEASKESIEITKQLIEIERDFAKEMEKYL